MKERIAVLVAIGDELLEGRYPDSNSSSMAARLLELGVEVRRVVVLGDDEEQIAEALRAAASEASLVVMTGGLGPTLDDVSRGAAARAAGVSLERSDEAWAQVCDWYERAGRERPQSNERQALVPAGATVLANSEGTAPGFRLALGESTLFALPGPPREMQPMFAEHVLGWLRSDPGHAIQSKYRRFHLFGLSESLFADRAGDWMARSANPRMGVTFKAGTLTVRLAAFGSDATEAQALLDARGAAFLERFGSHVYSESEGDPAVLLSAAAARRGWRIAVAESCTGGRVASSLTALAGASEVFQEGFVTYSNEAKSGRLGVASERIEAHGAVSEEVARAMARGAARVAGVDAAVAVTGVAGPGGGSDSKPVGLVWFATWVRGHEAAIERRYPPVARERIQEWATTAALRDLTVAIEAAEAN